MFNDQCSITSMFLNQDQLNISENPLNVQLVDFSCLSEVKAYMQRSITFRAHPATMNIKMYRQVENKKNICRISF